MVSIVIDNYPAILALLISSLWLRINKRGKKTSIRWTDNCS